MSVAGTFEVAALSGVYRTVCGIRYTYGIPAPTTTPLEPAGPAQFVAAIDNADDFCLDEDGGFAYVTRRRANTLDRVPLTPRHGSEVRHIAGDPFDETLVGPSSAAWGRGPADRGRIAYVTTDCGTTAPPDGVVRRAALLRVELDHLDHLDEES